MSPKEVSWKIKFDNCLTFCIGNNIFEFAKLGPKTYVLYWPGESNYVRFIVENV